MRERCQAGLQALSSSLRDLLKSAIQTELRAGDLRAGLHKADASITRGSSRSIGSRALASPKPTNPSGS